jgi:hypothetical protein
MAEVETPRAVDAEPAPSDDVPPTDASPASSKKRRRLTLAERQTREIQKLVKRLNAETTKKQSMAQKYKDLKSKKALRRSPGAAKIKRVSSTWVASLKEFNANNPTWTIPKKGTKDYERVKQLQKKYQTDTSETKAE